MLKERVELYKLFIGIKNHGEFHGSMMSLGNDDLYPNHYHAFYDLIKREDISPLRATAEHINWEPIPELRYYCQSGGFLLLLLHRGVKPHFQYFKKTLKKRFSHLEEHYDVNSDLNVLFSKQNGELMMDAYDEHHLFEEGNYQEAVIFNFDENKIERYQTPETKELPLHDFLHSISNRD